MRCHGSRAKLSPRAVAPFPIMIKLGMTNPRKTCADGEGEKMDGLHGRGSSAIRHHRGLEPRRA